MNLKSKSDQSLLIDMDHLILQERETLINILNYLREMDERRLYSELGFTSLFHLAVSRFGYSEDEAYRRLQAMRMTKELPEIGKKIESGELTLTNVSRAQKFFNREKKLAQKTYSKKEKAELLEKLENKSTREAEKVILNASSVPHGKTRDQIKQVGHGKVDITFEADEAVVEKTAELKGLLAHKYPNISLGELYNELCDIGIKNLNPVLRMKRGAKPDSHAQVIRDIWARAQNKCENCGSKYAPQTEHVVPQAKGGSSEFKNLKLLCRSCNQRAAIREFGRKKTEKYLNTDT